MSGFAIRAVVTLGIWTAAAVTLAFGVLPGNGTGNAAIILVPAVAIISTVVLWKWRRPQHGPGRQPSGQEPNETQDQMRR
jgi:membrane protein implicated in regulation of membrane protease activity